MFRTWLAILLLSCHLVEGTLLDTLPLPSNYAPNYTTCPSNPIIRSGGDISDLEKQWVAKRDQSVRQAWTKYLQRIDVNVDI